jgi:toxin-antitoxin system PIN domain toxin
MIYLADANLLIASALTIHVNHTSARKWFDQRPTFATTPITELALVRVATHKNYGVTFADALAALKAIKALPNYVFWPADLEVSAGVFAKEIPSGHTTDIYLLALAAKYGGKLATFDQGIAKVGGTLSQYLELLVS